MKKLQIICFVLLIGFSTSSSVVASKITLNFHGVGEQENYEPLLLRNNSNITVQCETPLAKIFSGRVDIYSVNYDGFNTCNATEGKLLGSLYCGLAKHQNTKALDFAKKEAETYYLIGFARKKNNPHKQVSSGGTCKSLGTSKAKVILHFCDPVITPNGKACTMESCPLSLGLGDGRIRDEQISASSELDEKHAAKHGRASMISSSHDSSWCAAPTFDLRTQYLQVDLLSLRTVSAVSTQGALAEKSWVSSYVVHYSVDGTEWIVITDKEGEIKEFAGNTEQSSLVRHWLKSHFHARFVRFVPLSWVGQRCMRVELHGCKKADVSMETLKENLKNAPRPCEASHCANVPHSTCFMYSGKPLCKCIQSCALDLGKVCGSDGVTYQNECEMKKTACLSKKQINISKRKPCSEDVSCKRKCTTPYSRCVSHQGTEERCECIHECPKVIKHVCGSDHVTYDNECLLQKTACEKNKEITVVKNGNCEESIPCERECIAPYSRCVNHQGTEERCECIHECPKVLKHVCGSDHVTYDNECLLQKTACEKNKEITVVKTGNCKETAVFHTGLCGGHVCPPYSKCQSAGLCVCPKCIHDGKKVCGSDGKTYNDICKLQKVACESNTTLMMAKNGSCKAPLRKAQPGSKEHQKEKKSVGSLKTFYICMIAVGVLGVAIALAMCLFQPPKSPNRHDRRNVSDRRQKNSFKSLHKKYRVEDHS